MRHEYIAELDGPQSRKEIGGRMILCKGDNGSSTTTASIAPELKPLATKYAETAIGLNDRGFTPYGGQRFADLNDTQYTALGQVADRAINGSNIINQGETALSGMLDGSNNPYLDKSVGKALDSVRGQVNTQFGGDNYGSTAHQEVLANSLGNTANQMYSDNYQADANRRLSAIGQSQAFGNQAYTDANQLMQAGQTLQDQQQQGMDFNYQQFQEEQNLPYKNLAAMSGVFGSNLGSQSTTKQSSGGK